MKIERLRKNHKKEIIVGGLILISIVSAITLVTTRAKYRVTQDIKLANGIVNYKPYDFKIIAMYQENDSGEYTEINEMPTSGYVVNESKSYCTNDNKTQVKGKIKTINGNHVISNLKKSDKCYVWFDKKATEIVKTLIGNLEVNLSDPDFSQAATTEDGIFKTEDGMYGGTSYYWRGTVTNNYVKFANKCWRIIRINGDGSIRLIYDGTTCHANGSSTTDSVAVTSQAYNANSDRSEYVGWTYNADTQRTLSGVASDIKSQTETWYNNNIGNNTTYANKVTDGKFCNDRNTNSGYNWSSQPSSSFFYAGAGRDEGNPTLSCSSGDVYTLKAGAITMDEVIMAGSGKYGTTNSSYYLYNGQSYWTMSPSNWNGNTSRVYVFFINSDGDLSRFPVHGDYGIRPVINLRSDITISSGNGTQNNPYVVS